MTGTYWPHLLAVAVGAGLTFQIGMNATLGRVVDSALYATVVNFAIGLAALVAWTLAVGARATPGSFGQVPWWAWCGGLLGAVYVASVTLLGPRLGAVAIVGLVLSGQLVAALAVDHFGAIGFPRMQITPVRLLGAALLVVGALLVAKR